MLVQTAGGCTASNGNSRNQLAFHPTKTGYYRTKALRQRLTQRTRHRSMKCRRKEEASEGLGDAIREQADQLEPIWGISWLGPGYSNTDSQKRQRERRRRRRWCSISHQCRRALFMRSNGGTHTWQYLCSLLATVAGRRALR
jgi:hypothetical protein